MIPDILMKSLHLVYLPDCSCHSLCISELDPLNEDLRNNTYRVIPYEKDHTSENSADLGTKVLSACTL